MQVSYKLEELARKRSPDAEDLQTLAKTVQEFATELLEPLKGDDVMRSIFEGKDFDRIAEKAVHFRQKKVVNILR